MANYSDQLKSSSTEIDLGVLYTSKVVQVS